jgi:hypothetical protein
LVKALPKDQQSKPLVVEDLTSRYNVLVEGVDKSCKGLSNWVVEEEVKTPVRPATSKRLRYKLATSQ